MEVNDDGCANCGAEFVIRNKSYKRHALNQKLRGSDLTPIEVLSDTFGKELTITPKRKSVYLCQDCASATTRLATSTKPSEEAKKELRRASSRASGDSYLKRKLDFSTSTPRKSKVRKIVVSTPVKKRTVTVENIVVLSIYFLAPNVWLL